MKNYTKAKTFETKQEIIVSVYWEIYKENVRIVLKVHILNSKLREYGAGGSASLSVDVIMLRQNRQFSSIIIKVLNRNILSLIFSERLCWVDHRNLLSFWPKSKGGSTWRFRTSRLQNNYLFFIYFIYLSLKVTLVLKTYDPVSNKRWWI